MPTHAGLPFLVPCTSTEKSD